jgi:hypothetical protein
VAGGAITPPPPLIGLHVYYKVPPYAVSRTTLEICPHAVTSIFTSS